MKIFVTRSNHNETILNIVDKYNRNVGQFQDYIYESSEASSILRFVDLLKKEGIYIEVINQDDNK